jgi:hypothetical protein
LAHAALVPGDQVELPGQGAEKPGFGAAQVAAGAADEKQFPAASQLLEKEGMAPKIDEWHGRSTFLKYYYNRPLPGGNPILVVTPSCDPKAAENLLFSLDRNDPSVILLPR